VARAVIFNDYMHIRGGGERSTLVYALALKNLGFEVAIVSRNPIPDDAGIREFFGEEFAGIETRRIAARDINRALKGSDIDLFVNHCNGAVPRNPAPFGIYVQMFPRTHVSWWRSPRQYHNLQSYQLMVNISGFTKHYADQRWQFPRQRSAVLHPPISALYQRRGAQLLVEPVPRKKQLLNIGRFSSQQSDHQKNQPLLLRAFVEARSRFPALADWSVMLVGPVMNDSVEYVQALQQRFSASGAAITLRHDLDAAALSQVLAESSMYVHTTGAFHVSDRDAFRCEHYGLSIVEAMAHGCIPLVYDRGGILEILKPAGLGVTYRSFDELVDGIGQVAMRHADNTLAEWRARIIAGVAHLNISEFTREFRGLLDRHGLAAPVDR
jgi:glycosyltransferase involved in cell wall biosynthesis